MTLLQLRNFCALARTGNMRRAAETLYVTEPGLSMSISKLEHELGLPLLERRGRSLRLTSAGWALAEHAERILQDVDEAERHMHSLAQEASARIRLGYVSPLARKYVPEKMESFLNMAGNAGTAFEVESGATADLVRQLKSGVYDLILCSDPGNDPALEVFPLLEQPLLLLSTPEQPVEITSLSELESLSLIGYPRGGAMDTWLSAFQGREKLTLRFTCRAPDECAIAALVSRNFGCAVVAETDGLEEFDLHRQRLPGDFTRTIFLVRLKDRDLFGASDRFFRFLRASLQADSAP